MENLIQGPQADQKRKRRGQTRKGGGQTVKSILIHFHNDPSIKICFHNDPSSLIRVSCEWGSFKHNWRVTLQTLGPWFLVNAFGEVSLWCVNIQPCTSRIIGHFLDLKLHLFGPYEGQNNCFIFSRIYISSIEKYWLPRIPAIAPYNMRITEPHDLNIL